MAAERNLGSETLQEIPVCGGAAVAAMKDLPPDFFNKLKRAAIRCCGFVRSHPRAQAPAAVNARLATSGSSIGANMDAG